MDESSVIDNDHVAKKIIKIKFVDSHTAFDDRDNEIVDILRKHYLIEYSDNPEYLFYSAYSTNFINYNCIRIFYTGENICPNFNDCDYALGYECMRFGDRYLRYPSYFAYKDLLLKAYVKHHLPQDVLKQKTDFCSFVYSNIGADPIRESFFHKLNQYKKVDSGGRLFNNVGGPVADKCEFERKHKFSIAFENGSHDGYVSEKILGAFAAQTIPIYWGSPSIAIDFNPKAMINVFDYESLDAVIERIKEIDADDQLYISMLQEPAFIMPNSNKKYLEYESFLCHIIDQPYEKAFRRNNWSISYFTQLKLRNIGFRKSLPILKKLIIKQWRQLINKVRYL